MIKEFIGKHPRLWEIFKFLIVGGGATIIDFVVMSAVLYFFAPDKYDGFFEVFSGSGYTPDTVAAVASTTIGFLAGLVFNYVFSLIFVFTASDTSKAKTGGGFAVFALLSSVGLLIHVVGMHLGYDLLHVNEWIVKIFLTLVVLVFNYLTRKYILFREEKQ
ncbi:MAG: GtrA family protein [Clostridia bacterium]|nr:GtrA family protein [Clostridia bacterium]